MLYRTKDQSSLNFLGQKDIDKIAEKEQASKSKTEEQIVKETAESQKSKKISNRFDPKSTNKNTILSANGGDVHDFGGPKKHLGSGVSNSIFDTDRLGNIQQTKSSKEKTQLEKQQIEESRKRADVQRLNDLADTISEINTSKSSSISKSSENSAESNYQELSNNLSLFDTNKFENIDLTPGEKLSKDLAEKRAFKDDSWKNNGKSLKSSEIFDNYLNELFDKK